MSRVRSILVSLSWSRRYSIPSTSTEHVNAVERQQAARGIMYTPKRSGNTGDPEAQMAGFDAVLLLLPVERACWCSTHACCGSSTDGQTALCAAPAPTLDQPSGNISGASPTLPPGASVHAAVAVGHWHFCARTVAAEAIWERCIARSGRLVAVKTLCGFWTSVESVDYRSNSAKMASLEPAVQAGILRRLSSFFLCCR